MTTPEERERTRRELHALAEFAKPASADSSGYVDLSTFSASDPNWIENALARARGAHQEPPHEAGTRRIDHLDAESMAPVEMSKLLDGDTALPMTPRRRAYAIVGVVWALGLGVLAITLARRSPPPAEPARAAVVGATAPAVPVALPPPVAVAPQEEPLAATAPSVPQQAAPPAILPTRGSSPKHLVAQPATRTRSYARPSTRAAAPPVIPRSTGGGDSLMNAIQQSFSGAAKK